MTKRMLNALFLMIMLIAAIATYSMLVAPTRARADQDDRLKLDLVVSGYQTVNPAATGNIDVQCPTGQVAVAGGYDTGSSPLTSQFTVNDNYFFFRNVTPAGWQVILTNNSVTPIQFRVYVSCTRGHV